jgi:hypothetical protein
LIQYADLDFKRAREIALTAVARQYTTRGSPSDEEWHVELEILGPDRTLTLEVKVKPTPEFPLKLPYIYLSTDDVTMLGFPPNVNSRGEICTYDRSTSLPDPSRPAEVLLDCIGKARRILEAGVNNPDEASYDAEFIAYWECAYPEEPSVDRQVLSLHPDKDPVTNPPLYVRPSQPIGGFTSILHTGKAQFRPLETYLTSHGISFQEIPTFFAGELQRLRPPFALRGDSETSLLAEQGLTEAFENYVRSRPSLVIITFTRTIQGRTLLLGWRHESATKRTGHSANRHGRRFPQRAGDHELLTRLSPVAFSIPRLRQRTSADLAEVQPARGKSVLIAGLGSVGSNLIPLLEAANFEEYRLVDPDTLSIDNIKRHLLGFSKVGLPKVEGVRDYLVDRNPLVCVETRKESLATVVREDPEFLNAADYHFFCTGDTNTELWIAAQLSKAPWRRPSFFIWLEPYLAGGHCIYCAPDGNVNWEALYAGEEYSFNVISPDEYRGRTFARREAGCQVSFTPYSNATVRRFLSDLFPVLLEVLENGSNSLRATWLGDKESIQRLGIALSDPYRDVPSFTTIRSPL